MSPREKWVWSVASKGSWCPSKNSTFSSSRLHTPCSIASMPSQKRYRQNQESNNSARFRDIPPRFKRQKSSTLAEESSFNETTLESQKSITSISSKDTKRTDSQESVMSPALMAPSYSIASSCEENLSPQVGTITHILQTSPMGGASAWQCPQKQNGALILSPWDSRHFDKVTNIQSHHVPLGTHFGYKSDSPPLSPWASTDTSNFSGQHSTTNSPTWMSASTDPCTNQRVHSSSGYLNNENWAPREKVKVHSSSATVWCTSSPPPQHCNNPASSLLQGQGPLSSKPTEKTPNSKDMQIISDKQMIDYSDPDIRTIEMLRELERVADEKESECDNFGADRKSLVSHHLRMLMCAVDRYTEGIDDNLSMATRGDEVTTDTQRGSPAPNWTQKQVTGVTREATPDLETSMWSPSLKGSAWKGPAVEPVSAASVHLTVQTNSHESLIPSPQASPPWKHLKIMKNQETAAWDLWSSPSFDFSRVLTEKFTRDPFGRFKDENERERKPLYQR